ncbi:PP2C family serine/threonine-protein phosphatase [Massilia sp. HP4]|uniref:PP2C family protein-serine/threonine phosphatase n=1 Tax=Massilia sp. HP4 TaxID=2562316 RepID=UPI0010C116BC|nr:protein phosphatase 2C domain-containing protein [Massilia sp. HP4]
MLIHTPEHPRLAMQACGMSEAGAVRARNEDCFVVDAGLGLAAVADGMGGHMAGEVASSGALAALVRSLAEGAAASCAGSAAGDPDATELDLRWDSMVRLRRAVDQANALLYEENRAHGHADGDGMGSTLTGLQFLPAQGAIVSFHVGDSRLYRCRDGILVQLTRDQTAYQLALESSAPGELPPRNLLLQAIGPAPAVAPDLDYHEVCAGDLLLLCSDGLHGWAPHAEIAALLRREEDLHAACAGLLALAGRHASRDNVTVLLARFGSTEELAEKNADRSASSRPGLA